MTAALKGWGFGVGTQVMMARIWQGDPKNRGRHAGNSGPWQNRDKIGRVDGFGESFERKQIPQVVENPESGANQKESLEPGVLRVKQP